ncbi:MAG: alanine/glycine:cation symporter family protein [Lachnospiraceae bacterium]|nr:alanine/glycine:cation symporter family protein [Lachnospiraceae bacterium]
MEVFVKVMNAVNDIVWHPVMCVFLMMAALWFTVRLRGMQVRRLKDMGRCLMEEGNNDKDIGLSPFQAFATTVGGRVGTGNIAGTATAIFMGGPGALFWMWITAILGASTGMVECILGQAYKTRNLGELTGGPAFYMSKGMKNKTFGKILAVLFCIAVFIGPGFLLPAMQTQTAATAVNGAFGLPFLVVVIAMTAIVGVVIMGGIKRIGQVAELLSPIMCGIYFLITVVILVVNIQKVPSVFGSIFTSAFGKDAVFGGIVGSAVAWGIKRGFFSNDAGNGMSPLISATTDTSHPVKQGLVQGLSVYIDTLLVCTCTGISVLMAGTYNVAADGEGAKLLVEHAPGVQYGIAFMQQAMSHTIGKAGAMLLAIMLFVFIFTTMLSYSYQLESTCKYLFGENKTVVTVVRILFMVFCMFGILIDGDTIWPMGDIGVGCMLWVNTFSILLLTPTVIKIVKDYEKQAKLHLDPLFDPATVGIDDEAGVWDSYVQKKRERGDYENEALGYNMKK